MIVLWDHRKIQDENGNYHRQMHANPGFVAGVIIAVSIITLIIIAVLSGGGC